MHNGFALTPSFRPSFPPSLYAVSELTLRSKRWPGRLGQLVEYSRGVFATAAFCDERVRQPREGRTPSTSLTRLEPPEVPLPDLGSKAKLAL